MAAMTSPNPRPTADPSYHEQSASPTVQYYEDAAAKQESSPVRWLIKLCRAITWVFYAIVIINTILIGVAFLLELFGANPEAGFVEWVYRSTARAMQPFHDIFPPVEITSDSTLDTSLLFAIVIYLILIVALHALLNWLQRKLIEQQTKMQQARATADAVAMDEQTRIAAAQAYAREQAARQDAARQEAARQQAIRDAAVRQEAMREEAVRQTAAAQAAAATAASQAAAASAAQAMGAAGYPGYVPAQGQPAQQAGQAGPVPGQAGPVPGQAGPAEAQPPQGPPPSGV